MQCSHKVVGAGQLFVLTIVVSAGCLICCNKSLRVLSVFANGSFYLQKANTVVTFFGQMKPKSTSTRMMESKKSGKGVVQLMIQTTHSRHSVMTWACMAVCGTRTVTVFIHGFCIPSVLVSSNSSGCFCPVGGSRRVQNGARIQVDIPETHHSRAGA